MYPGHDTTSASLAWCLYEIGRRPEVQEKLIQEIDAKEDGGLYNYFKRPEVTE